MKKVKQEFFSLPYLVMTLLFFSCSTLVPDPSRKHRKNENYKFSINENFWKETEPDTSDYAFVNPKTGSHLVLNSLCKKYENSDLNRLKSSLLAGINNLDLNREEIVDFAGRKAKVVEGKGECGFILLTKKMILLS